MEQWKGQLPDKSHRVLSRASNGRSMFCEEGACAARCSRVLDTPSNPGAFGAPSRAWEMSSAVIGASSGCHKVGSMPLAFQEYACLNHSGGFFGGSVGDCSRFEASVWSADLRVSGSVMLESVVESHNCDSSGEFCGELKICVE